MNRIQINCLITKKNKGKLLKAGNAIETLSKQPDWRKASGEKRGRARFEVDKEETGRWVCSPACLSFSRREKKGGIATKSISPTYPMEGDPGKESKADGTPTVIQERGTCSGFPSNSYIRSQGSRAFENSSGQ